MENNNDQQKPSDGSSTEDGTYSPNNANTSKRLQLKATTDTAGKSCELETRRMQLELTFVISNSAANYNENHECVDPREPAPCERPETNHLYDEVDLRLPSPPSASPEAEDREDSAPVSVDNADSVASSLSEIDSYTWSLASSGLPSQLSLHDEMETLIWPLEDEFPDYEINVRIGGGASGSCYLATELPLENRRLFCVKKCQYRPDELLALQLAKKENVAEIVDFLGAKLIGGDVCIFMEFVAGGTIADLIEEKKGEGTGAMPWPVISETDSLCYLEDVLKALSFIHSKGIVHRDIKGQNVLLTEDFLHAKLADFGSAERRSAKVSPSIDIWKTGCLCLEMLNGERSPLIGIFERGVQRQNSCKPEDQIPLNAMPVTKDLVGLCFGTNTADPDHPLPSATEVLKRSRAFPVKEFLTQFSKASIP